MERSHAFLIFNHVELNPSDICLDAIREYSETKLDFPDCMAVAYHKAGYRVFTFDKEINRRMNHI